jgi:hypothetical protein
LQGIEGLVVTTFDFGLLKRRMVPVAPDGASHLSTILRTLYLIPVPSNHPTVPHPMVPGIFWTSGAPDGARHILDERYFGVPQDGASQLLKDGCRKMVPASF